MTNDHDKAYKAQMTIYMKARLFFFMTIMATIISGCRNNYDIRTETIQDNDTTALCEGCPGTFEFSASLEFPVGGLKDEALRNIQNSITSVIFGKEYKQSGISSIINEYKQEAILNYRDSNLEEWKEFGQEEEWGASFSWVEGINAKFLKKYNGLQSYSIYRYGFTGGAHGIDSEEAIVFDLKSGKVITADDIFKSGWENTMSQLLSSHLKEAYEDPEAYEMLFVKEIEPNGNFYVTEVGITYIYDRYEIGPYVVGITKVTVPWDELNEILK